MLSTADMELEELTSALMSLSFSDLIYALIPPFWNSGIVMPILCRCLLEICYRGSQLSDVLNFSRDFGHVYLRSAGTMKTLGTLEVRLDAFLIVR